MSSKSIWAMEPGYGSVRELCTALGYGSDIKTAPRFWRRLRGETMKHRHKFIENTPGLSEFPLDYRTPEVQLCAQKFLAENCSLFGETQEALAFRWPIHDRDMDQILLGVAKLFCTQEWYTRKNNAFTPVRKPRRDKERAPRRDIDESENTDDADTHYELCSDSELWDMPPSQTTTSTDFATHDAEGLSSDEDTEEIERLTVIHLEYTYPMDGSKDGLSSDWIFPESAKQSSNCCPDDVLPYVFRYLHDHTLYSTSRFNMGGIKQFEKDLKLHLQIDCTENESAFVFERCKGLVSFYAGKWKKWGFLMKDKVTRRTSKFETAWKARKLQWMAHTGRCDIPTENSTCDSFSISGRKIQVRKRDFNLPPEIFSEASQRAENSQFSSEGSSVHATEEAFHAAKRQKTATVSDQDGESSVCTGLNGDYVGGELYDSNSVRFDGESIFVSNPATTGNMAPVATMVAPQSKPSLQTSNTPPIFPSQGSTIPRGLIRAPESLPRVTGSVSLSPSAPSAIDPACHQPVQSANVFDILSLNSLLENRSTPYQITATSIEAPRRASVSSNSARSSASKDERMRESLPPGLLSVPVDTSTAPGRASKPTLHFVFEKWKGAPDFHNKIPKDEVWHLALEDFFSLVCKKSKERLADVSCITLRYCWGGRDAFLVQKSGSERDWQEAKECVKDMFFSERKEKPKRERFLILVKVGDAMGEIANLAEDEEEVEEEEDW